MKLLIPTYRRVSAQTTFSLLTDKLKKETIFVVDEEDYASFSTKPEFMMSEFWVRPAEVQGIANKRAWIITNYQKVIGGEKLIMLDDDLSFEVRDGQGSTRAATKEDLEYWLNELYLKLDTYAHAGFSVRRHNNNLPPGWFENSRMQCVLGYRPKIMVKECELGRIQYREDFDYTMQLLKKGYPNAICSEILFSQKYNAPGGISTYRTLEHNNAQALELERLHPGLVTAVQRKYKGKYTGDMQERIEVICYWKKAFAQGMANYGARNV